MTILSAVQEPNYPLREKAALVKTKDGNFSYLKTLCDDMRETMKALDGIGIAAPQVGEAKRIFLIELGSFPDIILPSDIFINPKITKKSFKRATNEEGCLSVKNIFGQVRRAWSVTIEAYDSNGKKFKVKGSGLLARVFQHETDHLDGVLFIDKVIPSSLHTYIPLSDHE